MTSDASSTFQLVSLTVVTAALLAWLNHKLVKLPTTIGVMVIALGMSLGLFGMDIVGIPIRPIVTDQLARIDFSETLLDAMLAFLLFAGALHVQLDELLKNRWVITILASAGVIVTTVVIAAGVYFIAEAFGIEMPFIGCLLFGALISPTDPVAVLGIIRTTGVPKSLEMKIAGESLFNDGIGVVVFTVLLAIAGGGHGGHGQEVSPQWVAQFFAVEVLGAIALGLFLGWLCYWMMKGIDNYQVEVLISLALCMGAYSTAAALHSSGPLAVVTAGLLIGNTGRDYAMSHTTAEHIDTFWELIDEILNVVLFVLIGAEVLILTFSTGALVAGLVAIPLVLVGRFVSVGTVVSLLRSRREFSPHAIKIMTWGGLKGGISVALALALPADLVGRDTILTMTYVVVIFSIIVQGLTIGPLIDSLPGMFSRET